MYHLPLPLILLLSSLLTSPQETATQVKPVDPLDGTSWKLLFHGRSRPPEWLDFHVEFVDGKITGFSGCNRFEGTYQVSEPRFEILEVEWVDRRHCETPEGIMERESFLFIFFQASRRLSMDDVEGGRLFLYRPDGEALTFKPMG